MECNGKGCKTCMDSGFKGRVAISEGFIMDEKIEELILNNAKPYQVRNYLEKKGITDLYHAGTNLVKKGSTTQHEIDRVLTC